MKTNIAILIIIALATYGLTLYFGQTEIKTVPIKTKTTPLLNEQIPSFSFTTLDGKTHAIENFKDKIIILNFWASWCAPCVKEFPLLLNAAHENKNDLVLIALSSDIDENAIHNFIKKMKTKHDLKFNADNIFIAFDENQAITADIFGTFKLPETILIAPNQTMRHKFIGANWTKKDLQDWLEKLRI